MGARRDRDSPSVAQFCVPLDARIAAIGDRRATVREVRIDDGEVMRFAGLPCTTPLRTAFDLLRDPQLDESEVVEAVAGLLAERPGLGEAVRDRLDAATRMPYKTAALARLGRAEQAVRRRSIGERAQPSLTR